MRRKPPISAPTWYNPKNYDALRKLNLYGWYQKLFGIYKMSADLNLGIHTPSSSIWIKGQQSDKTISHLHTRTITLITTSNAPHIVEQHHLPALLVRLDAPDAIIMKEVKSALQMYRRRHGTPVASPGRYSMNAKFTRRTFDKWQTQKIIQLADALAWRARLSPHKASKYTDSVVGSWIGLNSKRQLDNSMKTLKDALANLDAMAAQLVHEPEGVEILPPQ